MSKNIAAKEAVVSEIQEKLAKATSIVLVDYKGVNVEDATELRKLCREENVEYKVYKNTLFKRAAAAAGVVGLDDQLQGTVAVALSYGDVVAPARTLNKFLKAHAKSTLEIKAGVVEGKLMSAVEIKALGDLPSKEVLIAMLLGALQGSIRNLAYVLDTIRASKEQEV